MTSYIQPGPQAVVDAVRHVAFGPVSVFQNLSIVPLLSRDGAGSGLPHAGRGARGRLGADYRGQRRGPGVRVEGCREGRQGRCCSWTAKNWSAPSRTASLNLTILVPAPSTTAHPGLVRRVRAVAHRSRAFASAPRAQFAEGRAAKVRQVTARSWPPATGGRTRTRCGA